MAANLTVAPTRDRRHSTIALPSVPGSSTATPVNVNNRPRVLIIDDDVGTCESIELVLRQSDVNVQVAHTATAAAVLVDRHIFNLWIVDLRLPDMSGEDLVRKLRHKGVQTRFILLSGFLTVRLVIEAMHLGAADVIEKPFDIDDLAKRIIQELDRLKDRNISNPQWIPKQGRRPPRSVAERWAYYVLGGCASEGDLKTLEHWATCVGVSYTSLCEQCRILGIRPHDARDFMRVLRALMQSPLLQSRIGALLDVADRRTLFALLERSGIRENTNAACALDAFLSSQGFVSQDNPGLEALRRYLKEQQGSTLA